MSTPVGVASNGDNHDVHVREDGVTSNRNAPAVDIAMARSPVVSIPSDSLRRAGLHQPRSFASSYGQHLAIPHSQNDIRASTMRLSNIPMSSSSLTPASLSPQWSFTPRLLVGPPSWPFPVQHVSPSEANGAVAADDDDDAPQLDRQHVESPSRASNSPVSGPSGLSILMARASPGPSSVNANTATPRARASLEDGDSSIAGNQPPRPAPTQVPSSIFNKPSKNLSNSDERTPLLRHIPEESYSASNTKPPAAPPSSLPSPSSSSPPTFAKSTPGRLIARAKSAAHEHLTPAALRESGTTAVKSLPAVLLGSLLNILDGVSYGMILFPSGGIFSGFGGMGVSMFFVTVIISQFVYTCGGSGFAGANGSMMIEVVPFFHILANSIASQIGEDHPAEIVATTLVAFAISSLLTGIAFMIFGALRLGSILGFFPRHILVGCIGGVGAFLIETGLTVSMRIDDDQLGWNAFRPHYVIMWLPALLLAILLRLITHKFHHQLVFPVYFLVIPAIFYIVIAAAGFNLGELRKAGWIFDMATDSTSEQWYTFYTYFDFSKVRIEPLLSTMPTQMALLFFNVLHPPLNVPALSVSLDVDVDTNKELVAHGYSNILAGLFGTVPNYLVYVNTLLFYRVGGDTRIASFLLAIASILLLIIGTGPISYIPVMVVGALIFVLGIDLVKEALWDTRHRTSRTEYITIISIMVCMTIWDFVIGVLFGIIVSCFFFVVQNSQRRSIRSLHTGETSMSTVRRPGSHRAYLSAVAKQTTVIHLHGFLFFGTIAHVEDTIRDIVAGPTWEHNPVRFLVLDFTLVAGVDMSAAEALLRVKRILDARDIVLVFCGVSLGSPIGKSLESVGVLEASELFSTFNDAMEWTENAYLHAWFNSQKQESLPLTFPGRQDTLRDFNIGGVSASSPRRAHIWDAGTKTKPHEALITTVDENDEPFATLYKTFSFYGEVTHERFGPMLPYFEKVCVPEGAVLWSQGDAPDGIYLIEQGILRALYAFAEHAPQTEESMVPGTTAGELSALSNMPRNATVVVERSAILWKLSTDKMKQLERDHPEVAHAFTQLALKTAKIDYDVLLSALASRQ